MKKIISKIKERKQKGLTLIETLVAISILVVAIVGPMEIASKGLSSAFYARDEITAYYLGQEALEVVRNVRDNAHLESTTLGTTDPWYEVLSECIDDTKGCSVEVGEADVLVPCGGSGGKCNSFFRLDLDNVAGTMGGYSYTTGGDTKFKRFVSVTKSSDEKSLIVQATVLWNTGGVFSLTRQFVIKERLFDWQIKQ